ncbi:LacI family transcriptional regulator [Leifsonia xyli subsp. xyli]|uniref:Transcriptional regulator, LacI family n=2 Tax=Leifsonia xyli subsp. xyli TaxID=59736 RepID=Q6ACD0_LEIXX|nr:LacI family DNA-binding transcriptional regulator [Leifsonia xyli]AAT89963.1 transcriptional regulator, LacI family [Leifsonia xyli subsp. xyli str. CTCB07]ODA90055.1 LacI family transcriptional regulator [Leifsonia xyli subsp. xyli]
MTETKRGGERLNVRQIAELAGVSTATVSRVYRGVGQVSPAMRERVSRAIAEHGYRPSHFGAALANRRNGTLGIVFPGLSGPYFGELIEGFERAAIEAEGSVTIFSTHTLSGTTADLAGMVERVDGLAVHAGVVDDETLARLADLVPVVVIGGDSDGSGVPAGALQVRTDHDRMHDLVAHLVRDHGRRRIAFLGRPGDSPDIQSRYDRYESALLEAGLRPQEAIHVWLTQSDGVLAAPAILERVRSGEIDAAVCANDELALGLMFGALAEGMAIGEDVSITGVDDVPLSSLVTPGLTTLARPLRELSGRAAAVLLERIAGRPAESLVLPSKLVRRASCGCAPEDG